MRIDRLRQTKRDTGTQKQRAMEINRDRQAESNN